MKTKRDIIIVIRFCFTNLGGDYSKIKCPAARSEQALVICHSCTSDLCTPYFQLLPAGAFPAQCCSSGWSGTKLGMLEGTLDGWVGATALLFACVGSGWDWAGFCLPRGRWKGRRKGRAKPKLDRISEWEVEADPREAGPDSLCCTSCRSRGHKPVRKLEKDGEEKFKRGTLCSLLLDLAGNWVLFPQITTSPCKYSKRLGLIERYWNHIPQKSREWERGSPAGAPSLLPSWCWACPIFGLKGCPGASWGCGEHKANRTMSRSWH